MSNQAVTFDRFILPHLPSLMIGSNRSFIAIIISLFLSAVYINKTIRDPQHSGLFGSVFFSIVTLILLGMEVKLIPIDDRLGGGLLLLNMGLSNLVVFMFRGHQASNLIWAFVLSLVGLPFIIGFFEAAPLWLIEDYYITYWPIILIFAGLVILIDRMVRRKKNKPKDSFHQ